MSLKYLCRDRADFEKLNRCWLDHLIKEKPFPIVLVVHDDGVEREYQESIVVYSLAEFEDTDGYPMIDVRDTYIVHLKNQNDCMELYRNTESWSPTTFQNPNEWLERPYFVVSGGVRCRWHHTLEGARDNFPWAPLVSADYTGENFNEIDLEEVLAM